MLNDVNSALEAQRLLKNNIIREIKHNFNDVNYDSILIPLEDAIDLLFDFIKYTVNEPKIDGLEESLISVLKECYSSNATRDKLLNGIKVLATGLDPLLKKILYLKDNNKYLQLTSRNKGLKWFIDATGILRNVPIDAIHTDSLRTDNSYYQDFIYITYESRNEIHDSPELSTTRIHEILNAILVTYIIAIVEHYDFLLNKTLFKVEQLNFLEKQKNQYGKWLNKFVDVNSKEKMGTTIGVSPLAIEVFFNDADDEIQRRSGLISSIIYSVQRLVILGSPGIGKSTTMQFLVNEIATNANSLPIYIQLKDYVSDKSIEELILDITKFDKITIEAFLSKNKIWILLDGLNEVLSKEISTKLRIYIRSFIEKYPTCNLVISSRPQAYNNEFESLPTFELLVLREEQIKDLIYKHFTDTAQAEKLYSYLLSNSRLMRIARNPLMLTLIILIAQRIGGEIPDNRGLLLKVFIDSLISRERAKNPYLESTSAIIFLSALAFKTREKQLVGFAKGFVVNQLADVSSKIGIQNISGFIDLMIDLGLLDETKSSISFTHEMFQEYFSAEYIRVLWEDRQISLNELYNGNENLWEEPFIILAGIFDDPTNFVSEVLEISTLLAAKCIASSNSDNLLIKEIVHNKAKDDANNKLDINISVNGLLALVELEYYDDVASILQSFSTLREAASYRNVLELTLQNMPLQSIHKILKEIILINPVFYIGPVLNALETRSLNNNFFIEHESKSQELLILLSEYRKVIDGGEERVKGKHLVRFAILFRLRPDYLADQINKYVNDQILRGDFEYVERLKVDFNLMQFANERIYEILKNYPKLSPIVMYKYFCYMNNTNMALRAFEEKNYIIDIASIFALKAKVTLEILMSVVKNSALAKLLPIRSIELNILKVGNETERQITLLYAYARKDIETQVVLSGLRKIHSCKILSLSDNEARIQVFGLHVKGRIKYVDLPPFVDVTKGLNALKKVKFDAMFLDYNKNSGIGYFSARAIQLQEMIDLQMQLKCKVINKYFKSLEVYIEDKDVFGFIDYEELPINFISKIESIQKIEDLPLIYAIAFDLSKEGKLLLSVKRVGGYNVNKSIDSGNKKNKKFKPKDVNDDLALKLSEALRKLNNGASEN